MENSIYLYFYYLNNIFINLNIKTQKVNTAPHNAFEASHTTLA